MTLTPGQRAPARPRRPVGRLRRARHTGQALVELALILPIMLFLLLGALDLGRVFYANITSQCRQGGGPPSVKRRDRRRCSRCQ